MKTFEMKTAIHFGENALERLENIPYKRVLIITDPFVVQSKMIDLITRPLEKLVRNMIFSITLYRMHRSTKSQTELRNS